MAEMTKEDAIEEIIILRKKTNDNRYKEHYLMEKRIEDLATRFNISYGDVWGYEKTTKEVIA